MTKRAIRVYYAEGLELRPDGLGAVAFGDNEDDTMAILTGLLGDPQHEWVCNDFDYCTAHGYGWSRYIREVTRESEKLSS